MRRSPSPKQPAKRVGRQLSAKNTNSMLAMATKIRQQELPFDRQQWLRCQLQDNPLSAPTLAHPLLTHQNKQDTPTNLPQGLQSRTKCSHKNSIRSMEEEHRQISRQNMQLLGLTINKINYSMKGNSQRKTESTRSIAQGLIPEVLVAGHHETIQQPYPLGFTLSNQQQQSTVRRRPQTVRKKSRSSQADRRRSVRTINPQYLNPVYEARFSSYRELLFRLHWNYGIYMEMDADGERRADRKHKAWVGPGNNSGLLKELIKRRYWWTLLEEKNPQAQFIWTQLKIPQYFKQQKPGKLWLKIPIKSGQEAVERVESKLLSRHKSRHKQEEYPDDAHLKKIFTPDQQQQFRKVTKGIRSKQLYQRQSRLNLRQVSLGQQIRVHNHLINNFYLGNKKALYYSLKQYYQLTGGDLFSVIPLTFHIRHQNKDPQLKRFEAYHRKREAVVRKQQKQKENGGGVGRPLRNIWIVKPGQVTNRGNGITVIDQIYELNSIMKTSGGKHDNGTQRTFIIQLYIDRPFLYRGRKFDIRHFVMISQVHGVMRAYWYKEGYIRTSSYEFDIYNFDREIHLTNDAVQKQTSFYGKYQPANKISYAQFQKYLTTVHPKKEYNFAEQILEPMKNIALDAIRSVFVKISPERPQHNFEIFGLDFMVDHDFRPWLIEVNTNPCLEMSCPLLAKIIPNMLDQALRLTLDVVIPPPGHYPNTAKHLVPESSLQALKYELIFDERVQGQQLRALYRRSRSNLLEQIGSVQDDEVYEDMVEGPTVPTVL